jgi:DNA-binding MarR family transcriptional regulator
VLQSEGPSTQQAVAEALSVSARNVSALVDALEASGFVRRAPHPSDRRAVMGELTPAAAVVMESMRREHAELDRALLAAVPPEDVAAFERGIDAITNRLTELVAATEADEQTTTGATR